MTSERPVCTKTFALNNGSRIPAIGLGTWQGVPGSEDEEAMIDALVHALRSGYRLLDTAQIYGVESTVGKAIRKSGVPRKEITLITKFWGIWHHDPAKALEISLETLGLEYVDIFLMHWPFANTPDWEPVRAHESPTITETWKLMESLVGPKCRAIGVSNFTQKTLQPILDIARIVPVVNQVELHVYHPCHLLAPWCQERGIHVISWGTLGGGKDSPISDLLTHKTFADIAVAKGCSAGVISLSWAVQRGITVIPKSASKQRLDDNLRLVDLSEEEMEKMNLAHSQIRKFRTADKNPRMQVLLDGKITIQGWSVQELGWEDAEGNWLV